MLRTAILLFASKSVCNLGKFFAKQRYFILLFSRNKVPRLLLGLKFSNVIVLSSL